MVTIEDKARYVQFVPPVPSRAGEHERGSECCRTVAAASPRVGEHERGSDRAGGLPCQAHACMLLLRHRTSAPWPVTAREQAARQVSKRAAFRASLSAARLCAGAAVAPPDEEAVAPPPVSAHGYRILARSHHKWARDDMAAATAAARPHAYKILARSHRQRMPGSAGQSERWAVGDEDDVEKKMVKEGGMR